jgi:hypothetical protein
LTEQYSQGLTNLSRLFTQLTGAVVPPPQVEHHSATIETEVGRINYWLQDVLQVLAEQPPSSPKIIGALEDRELGLC